MGTTTNGQICYGIPFEEGYEFPWDEDEDKDIDEWWRKKLGFKHTFEIYNDEGYYIDGVYPGPELVAKYFAEAREFDEEHPLPVELVNCCSGQVPIWILAVPSSVMSARRGCPEKFNPGDLGVGNDEVKKLIEFCNEYGLIGESEIGWYLSSYWG